MAGILSGLLLLLVGGAAASAAEVELGTLFFSPAERSAMDRLRRGEPVTSAAPGGATINGYVKKSDGKSTVWVSGRAYPVNPNSSEQLRPSDVGSTGHVILEASPSSSADGKNKSPGAIFHRQPKDLPRSVGR